MYKRHCILRFDTWRACSERSARSQGSHQASICTPSRPAQPVRTRPTPTGPSTLIALHYTTDTVQILSRRYVQSDTRAGWEAIQAFTILCCCGSSHASALTSVREALHLHSACTERAGGTENMVSTAYMRPLPLGFYWLSKMSNFEFTPSMQCN